MTVLYNGNIITVSERGTVQAIGYENGRIVFIGSNEEAQKLDAEEYIDLNGKTVLPGFNEGHMHLASYGNVHSHITLFECRSAEECIEKVKAYHASHPDAEYLFARGLMRTSLKRSAIRPKRNWTASVRISLLRWCVSAVM